MRYTVLTYIMEGYEPVREVVEKDPEAEYILVTDDPAIRSDTWQVVYDKMLAGLSTFDKCYQVLFHPFDYADTDTVVRIDGSIRVKAPLTPVIDTFENGGYDICVMIHPERNTMLEEYEVWCKTRNYPLKQAAKCLNYMKAKGYDLDYKGLYQGGFVIHRRNELNDEFCRLTYDTLKHLGSGGKIERIDQTISSFILNSRFADRMKVMAVSERIITNGNYMQFYLHNSAYAVDKWPTIQPYLFNQPIRL